MLKHRNSENGPQQDQSKSGSVAVKSIITILDQALVSLTNFITIVILAKLALDSVFASFALAWQAINYLRTTQERLISAPYFVFIHRPNESAESLLGSSLAHNFLFSLAAGIVFLASGLFMMTTGIFPEASLGLITLAFAIPALLSRDHLRAISFANFRSDQAFLLDILASILQLSGIGLLAYFHQLNLLSLAIVFGIASIIPVAAWFIAVPIGIEFHLSRLLPDWNASWKYAKWLVLARCFGIGPYLFIPWMIAARMGDVATGAFAACLSLVGLSTMFVSGLNNFLQPLSLRAYHSGGTKALIRSLLLSGMAFSLTLGPLCLIYYFFGSELLAFVYKAAYSSQQTVVLILGINVLSFSYAVVASNGLAALERPEGNFWGEVSNFLVSMAIALLFLDQYGLVGAATAIAIGSIVASIVTIASFIRIIRSIPELSLQKPDSP